MARLARDIFRNKPWRAAVKHDYQEYFLGYFATQEEAEEEESRVRFNLKGTTKKGARRVAS